MTRCDRCALHKNARLARIPPRGPEKPQVLIVGGSPGRDEESKGTSFVGMYGNRLSELMGIANLDESICRFTNLVRCVPWEGRSRRSVRQPDEDEIDTCSLFLEAEIKLTEPEYIVPMGSVALRYFFPKATSIGKHRGKINKVQIPTPRSRYRRLKRWRDANLDIEKDEYKAVFKLITDKYPSETQILKILARAEKLGFQSPPVKEYKVIPTYMPSPPKDNRRNKASAHQSYEQQLVEDLAYLAMKIHGYGAVDWSNYKIPLSLEELKEAFDEIKREYREGKVDNLIIDVETTHLSSFLSSYPDLLLFAISHRPGKAVVVLFNHPESPFYQSTLELQAVVGMTNDLIREVPTGCGGHNFKFDLHWLRKYGFEIDKVSADTFLASWTLFNDLSEHGLETLVTRYTDMVAHKEEFQEAYAELKDFYPLEQRFIPEGWTPDDPPPRDCVIDEFNLFRPKHYGDVDLDTLARYCAADADGTHRLNVVLDKMLREENLHEPHYKWCIPAVLPVVRMESDGVRIDRSRFRELEVHLKTNLAKLIEWFEENGYMTRVRDVRRTKIKTNPDKFNIGHWINKNILLYDILELKPPKKSDKGTPSSDKESLETLYSHCLEKRETSGSPDEARFWQERIDVIVKFQEYSADEKVLTSWVNKIPPNCDHNDIGHANFGIRTTDTGRLNCKGHPGWHGIKRGSPVKTAVVPLDEQGLIGIFDYSQMELRELANLSGDTNLIQGFRDGADIHRRVAAMALGKPDEDVTKEERSDNKAISLGVAIGGRGPQAVADQLGVSKQKAKVLIDKYLSAFPGVRRYFDKQNKFVQQHKMLLSEFGFRRLFSSDQMYDKDDLRRRSINTPIQCRAGSSFICTSGGVYTMSQLFFSDDKPVLESYYGQNSEYIVKNTGVNPVFDLYTTYGTDRVTENHQFFCYDNKDLEVRKLKELVVGDFIAASPNNAFHDEDCSVPEWATEELAELVGILLGDGCYVSDVNFYISIGHDTDYGEQCISLIKKVFPDSNPYITTKGASLCVQIGSSSARRLLFKYGLGYVSGDSKYIPGWILKAPYKYRVACLRGMYDTDGGVAGWGVPCFTNVSQDLASGFEVLVQSIGMLCRKTRYKKQKEHHLDYYKVWIPSDFAHEFVATIEPRIDRKYMVRDYDGWSKVPKQLAIDVANAVINSYAYQNKVKIGIFPQPERAHIYRLRKGSGTKAACIKFLNICMRYKSSDELKNLRELCSLYWAEVRSIQNAGVENTYDLEMLSDDHSYIAGGLLQHNSTSGDITTTAMSNLSNCYHRKRLITTIWATVHDSICHSIYRGELYKVLHVAKYYMEKWPEDNLEWLKVPLTVDFDVGVTWGNSCVVSLVDEWGVCQVVGSTDNFKLLLRRVRQWDNFEGVEIIERMEIDDVPSVKATIGFRESKFDVAEWVNQN